MPREIEIAVDRHRDRLRRNAHRRGDHLTGHLRACGERAEQQIARARSRPRAADAGMGLGLVDRSADVDGAGDRRAGLASLRRQGDAGGLRVGPVFVLQRFLERTQVHGASAPILREVVVLSAAVTLAAGTKLGPYEILVAARRRRDGRGVPGARCTPLPRGRDQGASGSPGARHRAADPLPPRGAGPGFAQPPAHRGDLRARGAGRPRGPDPRAGRRRNARRADRSRAASPSTRRSRSRARSPAPSRRRTRRGSCTGTSSPRT